MRAWVAHDTGENSLLPLLLFAPFLSCLRHVVRTRMQSISDAWPVQPEWGDGCCDATSMLEGSEITGEITGETPKEGAADGAPALSSAITVTLFGWCPALKSGWPVKVGCDCITITCRSTKEREGARERARARASASAMSSEPRQNLREVSHRNVLHDEKAAEPSGAHRRSRSEPDVAGGRGPR